ncbi:MAG: hypothetical protein ABI834_09600 [Ginsengibacter sp.]
MKDEFLNKKIDNVLQSLDSIKKASPRPFLFTRIEARMQKVKNTWSMLASFAGRPAVAFVCICFVLILNVMVIFLSNNSVNSATQQDTEIAAADEYNQATATLYEFENIKP